MSQHVSENLPRLLTGDATREETLAAAEHLRSCPDCQQELVAAVVSHAALTSARRFAPEVITRSFSADERGEAEPVALPDLRDVFAKAREEAATSRAGVRRRRVALGVAAAAVLATGVGVSVAELQGSDSSPPSSVSVALAPYDVGAKPARATLAAPGTMSIDATSLPRLDGHHFYEVWLTDPARKHLQAVGSLSSNNRAVLTVSPNVMARYSAIEVSIQQVNQTSFSGTSVLRGTYG
jgi:Anti-sigma-K factor rskA